jgi:hypothetical protein
LAATFQHFAEQVVVGSQRTNLKLKSRILQGFVIASTVFCIGAALGWHGQCCCHFVANLSGPKL